MNLRNVPQGGTYVLLCVVVAMRRQWRHNSLAAVLY